MILKTKKGTWVKAIEEKFESLGLKGLWENEVESLANFKKVLKIAIINRDEEKIKRLAGMKKFLANYNKGTIFHPFKLDQTKIQ